DRTRVELSPRARARLVELDARGAHLLLESGRAQLAVVHAPRARWNVSAGPFVVRVIGTRFDVQWDPERDEFDLDLTRGAVELSGCVFGSSYRVRAGWHIRASCKAGSFDA